MHPNIQGGWLKPLTLENHIKLIQTAAFLVYILSL